ncbi:hypothetical protein [Paractinoplanes durhamensis]|uniref:Uncharacterized protein n=1 Tax=Paractinoplanes durhamensis TaxID=113563 RepID=A0ABQ3ZDB9_9ACTN|nr:hypothetical protein [Actinoplanes durhamensis]GIE07805.1 hypothetical protein Adu01nite_91550 [Actinoplanes durhamensis]
MAAKDDLIQQLCSLLVGDAEVATENWQHLALVGVVDAGQSRMTGFCYDAAGDYEPAAPRNFETLAVLRKLRDEMAKADDRLPWKTCLVRVGRAGGTISVEFEYDDPDRWVISKSTLRRRADELHPRYNVVHESRTTRFDPDAD